MKQPLKEMLKKIGGGHLLNENALTNAVLVKALKLANLNSKVKSVGGDKKFSQVEFKAGGYLSVYTNNDGSIDGDYETPSGKHKEYDVKDIKQLVKLLKKVF